MNEIHKLCECGCGKEVTSEKNIFINGHNKPNLGNKGLKRTIDQKTRISESHKSEEYRKKYEQSMIENHGHKYPMQSKIIQDQFKQTCLKNLGFENPNQSEAVKQQKIQTSREHWDTVHPMQSKEVQEIHKQSCLKNLGVPYPMRSETVKEVHRQTCQENFGEDNWRKTPQGKLTARINYIKMVKDQLDNNEPLSPRISISERNCLNIFQSFISYNIIRNDHTISDLVGFFPDGHIPELKLFIEFDERIHFEDYEMTIYIQKDIDRELILASLGHIIFRVSEKQWKENQNQVITNFKLLIQSLTE